MARKTKCGRSFKKVNCDVFRKACIGCKFRPRKQVAKSLNETAADSGSVEAPLSAVA